ncbi:hypothetical protein S40285_07899 [Stachybotrys chlorohalonatus IBT 40285]|uniref:Rhodopsin domain-containing protein n=1 Tax=Stachybotrys chlorohalonatus (strain IBT 40285) TaxID=1283841 RepID=A0A084R223_STAC4|nr:hypothetical protein S40285_07899 [Stachybotrys chlorohalonata IBT 40285]
MTVENRGPELQAVGITLLTVAATAALLRFYVRAFIVRNFGVDDWCMVLAIISFTLFVTCALVGVHYGTGRHLDDLELPDIQKAMKFWWLCYIWYCTTMIASKVSIGCFLIRLTVRRIDIWIIYGVMAITVLSGVVFFFVTLLQCRPIYYFWDKSQSGSCIDIEVIIALTYMYSAFNVICDFTFALLPIGLIWSLNMDKKTKLALVPIMLMACVASAAIVVRFSYVKDFANPDFLWATLDIAIWSTTEQGLAITAGSLATLRPLIRLVGHSLGFTSNRPSELKDSGNPIPGSQEHENSRHKHRGPFSLTTFMRRDDAGVELASQAGDFVEDRDGKAGKGAPIWTAQQRRENDSEEALRSG